MCTREIDGAAVQFGTSGYTMDHVFVLYDRTSDSVWYPLGDGTFDAVAGAWHGRSIPFLAEPQPIPLTDWLDEHPGSEILMPTENDLVMLEEMRNRPYLGVRLAAGDDGLLVESVVPEGPAASAGIEAGDVLLTIAGQLVRDRMAMREVMRDYGPDDVVEIVVTRRRQQLPLHVTLGARDDL